MTASKNVFQRRSVPAEQVAQAEKVAAHAPLTGDPRLPNSPPLVAAAAAAMISDGTPAIYAIGQVYEVPLERIKSNPQNPRAVYTSKAIDEMAQSLRATGQQIAATGFVEGDYVVLIEGETRLRGARSAGLATLRVEIRAQPASSRELYRNARDANVKRRDQTPLDDAVRWKQLLEDKVYESQADLGRDLEIDQATVSKTLALADLPQPILYALTDAPELHTLQMLTAIRTYCNGFGPEKTLTYIPEIVSNGWGYRRVVTDAEHAETGPVRRPRGSRETVSYGGAKGEIKTFNGGRLELSFKGLDEEKVAALVQKIKELCSAA
jgi:ParB family chromosome partitioning protein